MKIILKKIIIPLIFISLGIGLAKGADTWGFSYHSFKGEYAIYGGELSSPTVPSHKNKSIAFSISGIAAQEMFEAIGPDLKGGCGTENGGRLRQKAQVACSFAPPFGYHCDFGFDLSTGKSIGGSYC